MPEDRLKNLTLQQLEALIYLVEERSFSRAAKRMLLTQPALTKNIRNVEDCLGLKVVHRGSGGIALTPEGKILYDTAKRMIKLRREAFDRIQKLQNPAGGDIYMGASTIPASYLLPRVASALKKSHPDIRIFVKSEDSEEVLNMVLEREVELGCIGKDPQTGKFSVTPLWEDRLILVVPKSHRWIKKGRIDVAQLLAEPHILREKGSATREVFETYFKEKMGIGLSQFNICGEFGSSEAIKESVIAGLGVSFLSAHAVIRELTNKTLFEIPVDGCRIERRFYLIALKQFEFRPHHEIFIRFIKDFKVDDVKSS